MTVLPEAIVAALCAAAAPAHPSPDRAAALRARVLARAAAPGFVTIPASADGWVEVLPKVHAKLLHTDGTAQSYLVRLEPGARAPAHDHPAGEECIVLEGEVRYLGGSTLRAGDYEVAHKGAHHTELVSDTGALVFLRYALPLENYVKL
jgi:quercetin dioxygenase-like cupin family protein